MSDKYTEKLDKIQRDLDWVVHYLTKDELTQIAPCNPSWPTNNVTSVTCSKCGMTFDGTVSYYCPQNDCPIFTKVSL